MDGALAPPGDTMALLEMKIKSGVLGLSTGVTVIMPQDTAKGEMIKVLWLLHGMSDDHTAWCRQTSVERYAEGRKLCVVMPALDISLYTDMLYGNSYFTYLTRELPDMLGAMLPISRSREDNYVAGLSMGGYGAFKTALNYPDRYSMAASLSGALDREYSYERNDEMNKEVFRRAFGDMDKFLGSRSDLRYMAKKRNEEGSLPELYMCCGTDDFLYEENVQYHSYLKSLGIPVAYEKEEGYAHTWEYWDLKIRRALEWMGL